MIILCRGSKTNASLETFMAHKIERGKELKTMKQDLLEIMSPDVEDMFKLCFEYFATYSSLKRQRCARLHEWSPRFKDISYFEPCFWHEKNLNN